MHSFDLNRNKERTLPDRVRLTIVRHGTGRFVEIVPRYPGDRPYPRVTFDTASPLTVRDLDGDGEPEVVLDLFDSGTRCCAWIRIYRFDRARNRYAPQNHWWGDLQATYRRVGHGLRDLDGDGRPEFIAADDRFGQLSYWAIDPIQIWSYDRGRFLDVTRRFPRLISADARANWRFYVDVLKQGGPQREALAAWMADEYLLGHASNANHVLALALQRGELGQRPDAYEPNPRIWIAKLKALLRRAGYTRA